MRFYLISALIYMSVAQHRQCHVRGFEFRRSFGFLFIRELFLSGKVVFSLSSLFRVHVVAYANAFTWTFRLLLQSDVIAPFVRMRKTSYIVRCIFMWVIYSLILGALLPSIAHQFGARFIFSSFFSSSISAEGESLFLFLRFFHVLKVFRIFFSICALTVVYRLQRDEFIRRMKIFTFSFPHFAPYESIRS